MKTTTIVLAGTLMGAAMFLADCNEDAAPVAKDSSSPIQVASDTTSPSEPAISNPPSENVAAPASSSPIASQPNGRLLPSAPLAPRTATRTIGAGVRSGINVFFDELGRYGAWVRHPDFSYV